MAKYWKFKHLQLNIHTVIQKQLNLFFNNMSTLNKLISFVVKWFNLYKLKRQETKFYK